MRRTVADDLAQQYVAAQVSPVGQVVSTGKDTCEPNVTRRVAHSLLDAVSVSRLVAQPDGELWGGGRHLVDHDLVGGQAQRVRDALAGEVDVQHAAVLGVGEAVYRETVVPVGDTERRDHVVVAGLQAECPSHLCVADTRLCDVVCEGHRDAVDEHQADDCREDDVARAVAVAVSVDETADERQNAVEHEGGQEAAGGPVHDSDSFVSRGG